MNKNIETKFYNFFWNDLACRRLFLQHKSELLQHNNFDIGIVKKQYLSPRFIVSNSLERKELNKKLALRTENRNIDLYEQIQQSIKKYIEEGIAQNYIEKRFEGTINKVMEDLADGEWWKLLLKVVGSLGSEKSVLNLLKEYELIPRNIKTYVTLETYILDEVKKELNHFLKNNNLSDIFFSIDDLTKMYDLLLRDDLLKGDAHFIDVSYDFENFKNRYELFDRLYEIGVLIGAKYKSYYECINCPPDTFSGMITTNIEPSSAKKLKCPSCMKQLYYVIPYLIHEDIYEAITHFDGILFHSLEFLFDNNNIKYKPNVKMGEDIEMDLCILDADDKILEVVEVKMFKLKQSKETKLGNLKQTVIQVRKMVEKLKVIDGGFANIRYTIITNYTDNELYIEAYKECKEDIQKYNITLLQVEELLANLKKR